MKNENDIFVSSVRILKKVCRMDWRSLDDATAAIWSRRGHLVTSNGKQTLALESKVRLNRPVACRPFYEAVRRAGGDLRIVNDEKALVIETHGSKTRIPFLSDDIKIPPLPEEFHRKTDVSIEPADLAYVALASSTDASRYALNGVCLDGETKNLVASDGKRLHLRSFTSSKKFSPVVIDNESVALMLDIQKLGHRVQSIGLSGRKGTTPDDIQVKMGPFTLFSKLVQGTFPNYLAVFPNAYHWTLAVETTSLKKALDDAILQLTASKSDAFFVSFDRKDGKFQLVVRYGKKNVKTYQIPVFKLSGDPDGIQWFLINPKFLRDALWTDNVTHLQGSTTEQPCLVDGTAIVMPIRPYSGAEREYLEQVTKKYNEQPASEKPIAPERTRPNGKAIHVASPEISRCIECGVGMKEPKNDLCEACLKHVKRVQPEKPLYITDPESHHESPKITYTLRKRTAKDLEYDIHEVWNAR